jgi:hypothetical protein
LKIVTDIEPPIQKEVVKEVPKQKILIASIRPKKGQFVWQLNLRTRELKKRCDYETTAQYKGGTRKKLDREADCLYVVAINKENAARKLNKLLDELEKQKL